MASQTQKIQELINKSNLTTNDKKEFEIFIKNIDELTLSQLTKLLENNPEFTTQFWQFIKKKIIFLQLLYKNEELSQEAKEDIRARIINMSPNEFNAFTKTLTDVRASHDSTEKMNEVSIESGKNYTELMNLLEKFSNQKIQNQATLS